jgi:quinol monooxygenase YgiN
MTTMVCINAVLKDGCLEDAVKFLQERFPETRSYDGCQGITAYLGEDGLSMVFIEHWNNKAAFEQYLNWRQDSGSFAYFSDLVEGEMDIRTFEAVDA